jgi:hypothetical protein
LGHKGQLRHGKKKEVWFTHNFITKYGHAFKYSSVSKETADSVKNLLVVLSSIIESTWYLIFAPDCMFCTLHLYLSLQRGNNPRPWFYESLRSYASELGGGGGLQSPGEF